MLRIDQKEYDGIRRHGEETYPHECCGILLGKIDGEERIVKSIARCSNAEGKTDWFNIDPREIMLIEREARKVGQDIIGFYHSHTDCPADWSKSDLEEAHWIGCSYVIAGVNQGLAAVTNSFALTGTSEEDKHFVVESIEIASLQKAR